MGLQLPNSVASAQDLTAVELEIHSYAKWFSHNAIKHQVGARKASLPPELTPAAAELVRAASGKQLLTSAHLDRLIKDLAAYRASAPIITITVAGPAPRQLKSRMIEWCRANIDSHALISFQYSGNIMGGMVVRYGSHIFDWSLRRKLMENRAKFSEVLRSA